MRQYKIISSLIIWLQKGVILSLNAVKIQIFHQALKVILNIWRLISNNICNLSTLCVQGGKEISGGTKVLVNQDCNIEPQSIKVFKLLKTLQWEKWSLKQKDTLLNGRQNYIPIHLRRGYSQDVQSTHKTQQNLNQNTSRRAEEAFIQRRHTNGWYTHDKMLNITPKTQWDVT